MPDSAAPIKPLSGFRSYGTIALRAGFSEARVAEARSEGEPHAGFWPAPAYYQRGGGRVAPFERLALGFVARKARRGRAISRRAPGRAQRGRGGARGGR